MKQFVIGTYSIHGDLEPILHEAFLKGLFHIDTAPNYRAGKAQEEIRNAFSKFSYTPVISTKVGFISQNDRKFVISQGILRQEDTYHNHNLSLDYVKYQMEKSIACLGEIDTLFVHNPEVQLNIKSQQEFKLLISKLFEFFEELCNQKKIKRYGIATWSGFGLKNQSSKFSVNFFENIAYRVASKNHHFQAIQFPINLILFDSIYQSFKKEGPLYEGYHLHKDIYASSPLYGGEAVRSLNKTFSYYIGTSIGHPNLSAGQSAFLFAKSHPYISHVLASPSNVHQFKELFEAIRLPDISLTFLKEITDLLKKHLT